MSLFLSISEIERLTGKKRPSAQIRWLINQGYRVAVNGLKQPIVAIAERNRKLIGAGLARHETEPNWDAMHTRSGPSSSEEQRVLPFKKTSSGRGGRR